MKTINILVAGVGGQGTLLASDILTEVGMRAGYDTKKSDVLGLAVRGGSVLSHVRWGERIASPVVSAGGMDFLVAFEPLEAMRGVGYLHSRSVVVCNTQPLPPVSVSSGEDSYPSPETIESALADASGGVHLVDATSEALRVGSTKVTNIVLLGAFSTLLPVDRETWEDVILGRVPERFIELNQAAFAAGRVLLKGGAES